MGFKSSFSFHYLHNRLGESSVSWRELGEAKGLSLKAVEGLVGVLCKLEMSL